MKYLFESLTVLKFRHFAALHFGGRMIAFAYTYL